MPFEVVLQRIQFHLPADAHALEFVVPCAAPAEARVHEAELRLAALSFEIPVDRDWQWIDRGERRLALRIVRARIAIDQTEMPLRLPDLDHRVPRPVPVPADHPFAADSGRDVGARRKPAHDLVLIGQRLPDGVW